MNQIKHAAVLLSPGESSCIYIGKSHDECIVKVVKAGRRHIDILSLGFVDAEGNFLTRKEAYKVASEAKQIATDLPSTYDVLISEDLWDEKYGGKYDYIEGEGYVRRQSGTKSISTTDTPVC